ncbi:DNA glycosylase [Actinophytocola xinjiangensis]|uniref:Endonuclease 8 1 n=1 Tax=Actinophytocola xinjiangensis TaxID=485602 RepID=A0A7Z0WJP5_9PSEU|nr:DNA-formamidopyrimidine glycosylase family protein [Actinophytocola xinjiangensis]OLF08840.1 DNA glycosylase [Actinophytocola xinjiangensis]
MPEGHTLHRLARRHQKLFAGRPVRVSSPQGRFTAGASFVDGRVLRRAEAYGKHLFHVYDRDAIVHVHLGLIGMFAEHPLPEQPPRGAIRMRMVGEEYLTDLSGPIVCQVITKPEMTALVAPLGPDPLRRNADPERAWARLSRSRQPVAQLLLDQRVLAGVGNVYRAEVLFRHEINPLTPGRSLDHAVWSAIWADLVTLMRKGVRSGRIDTVRPEHMPRAMGRPARADRHGGEVYVYRRTDQPCLVCGTPVATRDLAGRNLYWCPVCQA